MEPDADDEAKKKAATKKAEEDAAAAAAGKTTPPATDNAVAELIAGLKSTLDTLTTSVQKVAEQQTATEAKVAEALKKADTAVQAVKGTSTSMPAGDPTEPTPVKKADADLRTGAFDTGLFARRRNS